MRDTYNSLYRYIRTWEPRDLVIYELDDRVYEVVSYNPRSNFIEVVSIDDEDSTSSRLILNFYIRPHNFDTHQIQLDN